ncbi:MAG: SPOR domain-containing protein [Aestuariivirga sp.]
MKVRRVSLAFVSSVLFAALVANPGSTGAATGSAVALSAAGYQALSGGDANKAIPLFTQSIESRELVPDALANALLNRALAYQQISDNDRAIDDYTAALNLDAMSSDLRSRALYNRGLAQQKAQHAALAIEDFTSALLVNSAFSYAYLARANALRENGQYLFSISDYERALKYHHPEVARVYFGEALAYESLRRPSEAKGFLQAALKADANFAPAQEKLKDMGDVAQLDDETGDPILTASTIASPSAQTEVVRQALPKGIEPPAALMAQDMSADSDMSLAAVAEQPEAVPGTESVAEVQTLAPTKETRIVVASVPKVPNKNGLKIAEVKPVAKVVAVSDSDAGDLTASTTEAPPAAQAGWTVQVSSASSEDAAWATWKSMQNGHKVLVGQTAFVVKADLGAKGVFYRVRLGGFGERSAAQTACGKFKAAGIACFVSKVGV